MFDQLQLISCLCSQQKTSLQEYIMGRYFLLMLIKIAFMMLALH